MLISVKPPASPSKLIFTHTLPCYCNAAVDIIVPRRASLVLGPRNPFWAPGGPTGLQPARMMGQLCCAQMDFTLFSWCRVKLP